MDSSVKKKLRNGFTIARWGIDICLGALFITIALIVSAVANAPSKLPVLLMIPFAMCIAGLAAFAIGRVIVGLQSRKLHFTMDRALTEEERLFVSRMLELESRGAGIAFYNSAARSTKGSGDDLVEGLMASAVIGSFFTIGREYMGNRFFCNRWPVIVSLAAAIVIIVISFLP